MLKRSVTPDMHYFGSKGICVRGLFKRKTGLWQSLASEQARRGSTAPSGRVSALWQWDEGCHSTLSDHCPVFIIVLNKVGRDSFFITFPRGGPGSGCFYVLTTFGAFFLQWILNCSIHAYESTECCWNSLPLLKSVSPSLGLQLNRYAQSFFIVI